MSSELDGVISGSIAGFLLLLITLSVLTCIILYSKRQKTRFQGENNRRSQDITNGVASYNIVEKRSEHKLSNQDTAIANDGHILTLLNYGVRPSQTNSGDIPTSSNASYGVTSRMNGGDIPTSSNASYGVTSRMNGGDIPTSSNASYGVTSQMNSGDIPTSSNASYGVTSRMNGGDIPTSSNASYGVTSQMNSGDIPTSSNALYGVSYLPVSSSLFISGVVGVYNSVTCIR